MSEFKSVRTSTETRGTMPMKLDSLLFYLIKSCIGALFLYMFLVISLPILRTDPDYNIFVEIAYIIPVMIVSDFISSHLSNYIDVKTIKHWGYVRSPKTKKNRMFNLIEYILYLCIRVSFIMFGFLWFLFDYFRAEFDFPFNTTAFCFLTACIVIWLLSRISSWILANIVFLK